MTEIEDAARKYLTVHKWVPIALGLDAEGRPKRPFFDGWQHLTLDDPRTRKQGWARAKGVGLLCGPNSGNLAVIGPDVSPELAAATIDSITVLGALHASASVKDALAGRIH